jgi:magnesium transporter
MQPEAQIILERIRRHLDADDAPALAAYLNALHTADIAEVIGRLETDEQQQVLGLLDLPDEAEVLEYTEEAVRSEIVSELDDREVSEIAEEMPPEEAADLLAEMPEERAEHVLELMAGPEAQEVEGLLQYLPETAGGLMAPDLVRVREDRSVAQLLAQIRDDAEMHEEEVYNIYVVDAADGVLGTVSVWDLLRARSETPVRELMEAVHTIPAGMDQEQVAAVFRKYDLASAPVVDRGGRLLGRITFDDVQDVVEEEMTEDMSKFAGTDDEELASSSSLTTARLRLPWLLVCLAGTFVSGTVIHSYGATLQANLLLMVFVPAVMATAGNSGLQTATMTIRSLATGHLERVGVVAVACGVVGGVVAGLWSLASPDAAAESHPWLLGGVIGGSMFAAICLSATLGLLVPMTFRRIGIDPAVASGPLITTSSDIFSLLVYLGVATVLLVHLT